MKIKKSSDKDEDSDKRLARLEEMPWPTDPFREFERFMSEFSRDFPDVPSRFWGPRWGPRWSPRPWGTGGGLALKAPLTDLKDAGREFVLKAEIPGVTKDDIDITVHSNSVEIKAERQAEKEEGKEGYYYRERGTTSYYRRILLPEDVDADKAEGKLTDGVLELTLPKMNPTDSRKVKLQ